MVTGSGGSAAFGLSQPRPKNGSEIYWLSKGERSAVSKEEFLQFVEKQVGNRLAWGSPFTYFAGPTRKPFRVDFNQSGQVVNIAGTVGSP
jgi:hypothetical protein